MSFDILQDDILSLLVHNPSFVHDAYGLVRSEYFDSEYDQVISSIVLEHYARYDKSPSLGEIENEISNAVQARPRRGDVSRYLDRFRTLSSPIDATHIYILEQLESFARVKAFDRALIQAVDLRDQMRLDEIPKLFDDASRVTRHLEIGLDLPRDMDREQIVGEPMSLFIPGLEDVATIPRKEMGFFIAPSGVGKSLALMHVLIASVVQARLKAVYYTFEISEDMLRRRITSSITGIPFVDIPNNPQAHEIARQRLERVGARFFVKHFDSHSASTLHLERHMDELDRRFDYQPDVVIIDYGDLLQPRTAQWRGEVWQKQQQVYEEMTSLASKYNMYVFSASQANRSAYASSEIRMDSIAEAIAKVNTAALVITLARRDESTYGVRIEKNRYGPSGFSVDVGVDFATLRLLRGDREV